MLTWVSAAVRVRDQIRENTFFIKVCFLAANILNISAFVTESNVTSLRECFNTSVPCCIDIIFSEVMMMILGRQILASLLIK